ncbi:Integral membrane protein SED5 [Batrachochytrium dendrobatidis]
MQPADKIHLLNHQGHHAAGPQLRTKSEFTKAASSIGRDINSTMTKLQKLTTLAKRKSLFDDRPVEINELIYVIKQDIAKINLQIGKLGDYLARNGGDASGSSGSTSASGARSNNRQTKEHSHNVISSLQSKLATTSDEFKSILEVRFQNMKDQKSRRDQYSFASNAGSSMDTSDSPLYHPERRPNNAIQAVAPDPNSSSSSFQPTSGTPQPTLRTGSAGAGYSSVPMSADTIAIDFGSQGLQQSMMLPASQSYEQSEYLESRSQAIESIESTIIELGQIYQNFATVLAGQREMVQRIDDNVMDVQMNVEGAHTQLVKYYQNISSNRALMLKIFAAVIAFFLIFVMMT